MIPALMFFLFSILLWTPNLFVERVLAQPSSPFLYNGGIPLRTPGDCPTGSVFGQITFQQNCCGLNQTFIKNTIGSFCCPDDDDCSEDVENGPKCADPTWTLCGSDSDEGFCCEANSICFRQLPLPGNGGGVGCSLPGATLGLSQIEVNTVFAANAGPGIKTTMTSSAASKTTNLSSGTTGSADPTNSPSQATTGSIKSATTGSPSTSKTISTSVQSTATSANGVSPQTTTAPDDVSTRSSSGTSSGLKIGIAIAIATVFIAALSIGIFLRRKRRQNQPERIMNNSSPTRLSEDGRYRRQEMAVSGHETPRLNSQERHELQDREPTEMEDTSMVPR